MEYRSFCNAKVSLLGYGCMRFPQADGTTDVAASEALIDRAYQNGVNYFDTAYRYLNGESEPIVGNALAKYPRDSFYIATKLPTWMVDVEKGLEDVDRIFFDQLERCKVEYFDFYLVHALSKTSWDRMESIGAYDRLMEFKRQGKIRNLGFSFHDSPAVLEEICAAHPWDFVQIQLNYFDWEYQHADEQYAILEKYGYPCIVMEPVRGGRLATLSEDAAAVLKAAAPDKSIASWAIRYAASLPNVMTVLSGMSDEAQVNDNLSTFDPFCPLTDAEKAKVEEANTLFKAALTIPCTACSYCTEGCPQQIDIPKLLAAKNQFAFNGDRGGLKAAAEALEVGPDACIACGACSAICPQQIDIPKHLTDYAKIIAE